MAAGVWNPTIEQGATWHRVLTYLDDGQPIDLTGYTARMDIVHKLSRKTALQLDTSAGGIVIDGVAGTITLQLSAVQTATLDTYQHLYDLELVADPDPRSATAEVQRLVTGTITVSPQWTKP